MVVLVLVLVLVEAKEIWQRGHVSLGGDIGSEQQTGHWSWTVGPNGKEGDDAGNAESVGNVVAEISAVAREVTRRIRCWTGMIRREP